MNKEKRFEIRIREAKTGDVHALQILHREAVTKTAAPFYSAEVIESWAAKVSKESIARHAEVIESGEELTWLAEVDGEIAGFGSVVPTLNELRAVYVHPKYGRHKVGTRLLKRLEHTAEALGLPELHLHASLNAEEFYASHGFEVAQRGETLRGGLKMPCTMMRKSLPSLPNLQPAYSFAKCLDCNEFASAGKFLNTNCVYRFRDEELVGRDLITKRYQDNFEQGSKLLDEIYFESAVEPISGNCIRICYLDRIRKGTHSHDHRCEQIVDFECNLIRKIRHIDLPGESEALTEFWAKLKR